MKKKKEYVCKERTRLPGRAFSSRFAQAVNHPLWVRAVLHFHSEKKSDEDGDEEMITMRMSYGPKTE